MANVIATTRGYFGGLIREIGDKFAVPDGITASWFKPVNGDEPVSLSEPVSEAKAKPLRKAKVDTVMAETAEPFADAPAPIRAFNAINELTGSTQPDWISPDADI